VPCHCTAAGKALLARREAWREEVLEQPLESFTNVADLHAYERLYMDRLADLPGVARTNSQFTMKTIKGAARVPAARPREQAPSH
jgi:DNA-binding Lrp family transcriptional regulator